jgi:Ca2+-binding RTX toxin-like protein
VDGELVRVGSAASHSEGNIGWAEWQKLSATENDNNLFGTLDRDDIYGAGGEDILYGNAGDDFFDGGADKDFIDGGSGNDRAFGGDGPDILYGNDGDDLLDGGNGADTLLGANGNDTLLGNEGDDILDGQAGIDSMIGGLGNDVYVLSDRTDSIREAPNGGIDTLQSFFSRQLPKHIENLMLFGDRTLNGRGNSGDNILQGNNARNRLFGRGGSDRLLGHSGNDILVGEKGNDQLFGGNGRDRLIGSAGRDCFCFEARRAGRDRIIDFAVGSDSIGVSRKAFGRNLGRGTIDAEQFHVGSGAADDDDRFIYSSSQGALYFDPDGSGGLQQVQIASLASGLNLTPRHIVLIP